MKGMLQLRLRLASLTWTTVVYSGLRLFLAVEAHTYLITPPSRMTLYVNCLGGRRSLALSFQHPPQKT